MAEPIIFVDADACPVKDEAKKVAPRLGLVITIVSNGGIRPSRDPMVQVVVVPAGADAADDWIVDHAKANDIVLTADIPLASRAIDKGCHVLGLPESLLHQPPSAWLWPCAISSSICVKPERFPVTMQASVQQIGPPFSVPSILWVAGPRLWRVSNS